MPRVARQLIDENCYHVLTRGNNRAAVFHDPDDYQRYGQLLLEYFPSHGVDLYHYCLMTNHVHLVVRASTGAGLRSAMQGLNLRYTLAYKRKYSHTGHFWQDRFKSLLITDDSYLLQCGAYVELNPVRARMTPSPAGYPWSSARSYLAGHFDPLITQSPAYLNLGNTSTERQHQYQQFLKTQIVDSTIPSKAQPGSAAHWRMVTKASGQPEPRKFRRRSS